MDSSAASQGKAGTFACGWISLKAFPGKIKSNVINITNKIKMIGKDDPRRITHSIKVGTALTIVSLLYYWRPLYDGFGVAGMWAVLTVVVVFEFTVGATLSKGCNRGLATLLAGALALGAEHFATIFGENGEPLVLGIIVFLLAAGATFSRFFPGIKQKYDYGVMIFILTFSLVAVSGYRVDKLFELAHQRLSTILIGGAACIVISVFVCPVWAGEDLHKLVASNIEKLANYLEGFEAEYFQCVGEEESISNNNESLLQGYRSVLTSKGNEDNLANLARWEPGHGKFRLRHPWKQYLKVGALARECAYRIEALNSYINSDIQASEEFKSKVREPCVEMSIETSKALRIMASSIKEMTVPSEANYHVENSKGAIEDLQRVLEEASMVVEAANMLALVSVVTVASILIEITKSVEKISESVYELSQLAHFKKTIEPKDSPEKPHGTHLLHRGTINPLALENDISCNDDPDHVIITVHENGTGTDSPEKGKPKAPKPNQRVNGNVNNISRELVS